MLKPGVLYHSYVDATLMGVIIEVCEKDKYFFHTFSTSNINEQCPECGKQVADFIENKYARKIE